MALCPGINGGENPGARDHEAEDIAVISIDALLSRELGNWTNTMVHVNGLVLDYKPGAYIEVKDPTGVIRAQVIQTSLVQRDERVDLWGFLTLSGNEPQLKDASFEVLRAPVADVVASAPGKSPGTTNLDEALTQASDVMNLPKETAARHMPVRLTGVITYADAEWHAAFFHDVSGGIYVDLNQSNIRAGQLVQITGQTSVGGFAPEVTNSTIEVLGTTNLPTPAQVDLEDLINGHLDAHWVEMEGVVRRVNVASGHAELTLITRKGHDSRSSYPNSNDPSPPVQLIDALISVQGACGSEMNARGQLSGITLHVPSFAQVKILEPVPQDPFAAPTMPIGSVATFDAKQRMSRRVKLSGVVTLVLAGQGVFLQDASGGIRANTQQTADLHVGDAVDVLGFPAMGDFSPCLEEASFRKTGTGPLPRPMRATAEEILIRGRNDALVVQIEAQLVQNVTHSAQQKLLLQDGPVIFTAHLEGLRPGQELPTLKSGSVVRLTGVCSIQGGEEHEPSAFRLLVSSPDDVQLVKSPPWWSLRHTVTLAGILTLGIIVAFAWVRSLRRQVRAQTEVIHQKHKELLEISRRAGMAEVATGVLHNVGNVLNSVNITTCLMAEKFKKSKLDNLSKAVALLREHEADLGAFLTTDPKGREMINYFSMLAEHLTRERKELFEESSQLQKNVDHIKDIVAMQQNYARGLRRLRSAPGHGPGGGCFADECQLAGAA